MYITSRDSIERLEDGLAEAEDKLTRQDRVILEFLKYIERVGETRDEIKDIQDEMHQMAISDLLDVETYNDLKRRREDLTFTLLARVDTLLDVAEVYS